MPKPVSFLLSEYPRLGKLKSGQQVTVKFRFRAGLKSAEMIDMIPEFFEIDEGRKLSPAEVMLSSINESLNKNNINIP